MATRRRDMKRSGEGVRYEYLSRPPRVISGTALPSRHGQRERIGPASAPERLVVALVVDRRSRARLLDALRSQYRVHFAATVTDAWALLDGYLDAIGAVIVEPAGADGVSAVPLVAFVRERLPKLPVVAWCPLPVGAGSSLVALARAGVHDVIMAGVDDDHGHALRAILDSAEQACAASRVLALLEGQLGRGARGLVEYGLAHGRSSPDVGAAAAALGVHRRTLVNWCRLEGLPSPAMLLGWCRLFLAAALLEQPAYTVERVALLLDYPSVTTLRNAFRRYACATATDVRHAGGLDYLVARFLAQVGRERPSTACLPAALPME